jgi:hypothetical protein
MRRLLLLGGLLGAGCAPKEVVGAWAVDEATLVMDDGRTEPLDVLLGPDWTATMTVERSLEAVYGVETASGEINAFEVTFSVDGDNFALYGLVGMDMTCVITGDAMACDDSGFLEPATDDFIYQSMSLTRE